MTSLRRGYGGPPSFSEGGRVASNASRWADSAGTAVFRRRLTEPSVIANNPDTEMTEQVLTRRAERAIGIEGPVVEPQAAAAASPTPEPCSPSPAVHTALGALALSVAYWAGAQIEATLRTPTAPLSVLWLPNSIVLAALMVAPIRNWTAYLLAVFPAYLILAWQRGGSLPTLSLFFFTNCIEAMLGAIAVHRLVRGPLRFDGLRSLTIFLVFAATAPPVLVSFADAAIMMEMRLASDYWLAYQTLVRTDVLTHLMVVPALVTALNAGVGKLRGAPLRHYFEVTALTAALLATGMVVFTMNVGPSSLPALLYAPLPLLLWAAIRFGPGGASFALLLVAFVASWNAIRGLGPFTTGSPESLVALQLFLLAISLPLLYLAALMQERQRTASALRASEQQAHHQFAQLSAIYQTAPVGLAFVDPDLRFVSVSDSMAEFTGRPAAAHIGRRVGDVVRDVVPALAHELERLYRRVIETGAPILHHEVRVATASQPGVARDWLASYEPIKDEQGAVIGVNTVVWEITRRKRAEEELREKEAALRVSHEQIQDLAGRLLTAQEAERARIARELHDDVNQQLAALAIALSGLKRRLPEQAMSVRDELSRLQQKTVRLADGIRHLSHELHSGVLEHAGLVAALTSACAEFGRQHAIEVTFDAPDDLDTVPHNVALCLYRVAQEALRNIATHAGARRAQVALARTASSLELTIADDGQGFDLAEARRRRGLGLISVDERVRLVRGSVRIVTQPRRGTELQVHVPLGAQHASRESTARR